ncbi:MAG TPA: phosphoenolpyruvate carboxylase [Azospirillaceae bacterium]|nr:phosphoenolpyruvate carboxylase [Azospirillaceae bacterium]
MPDDVVSTEHPLLTADQTCFGGPCSADLGALEAELTRFLAEFEAATADDPFSNPVLRLALEMSRRLSRGQLDLGTLEQFIQHLSTEGFLARAERLSRYMGEVDPEANAQRLRALFRRLARPNETEEPVAFESFRATVEREVFGIVVTAHPTFNLSGELMAVLAQLATGRAENGQPLCADGRARLVATVTRTVHRPDAELGLAREHTLSLTAIANMQGALRQVYGILFEVARETWPERWVELTPKLVTVASWVGYDLDGRSDIRWTDSLHKRLRVEALQLRHYLDAVRAVRDAAPDQDELRNTLELIESRLALALNEVTEEVATFGENDPQDTTGYQRIRRIARRMHESQPWRLVDAASLIERIDRAIRLVRPSPLQAGAPLDTQTETMVRRLAVLRAELANYGLGMAHTHVRINATQLHNAIRKTVGMETVPDDPRFRQSYLAALNDLLEKVRPVTINFGSLIDEQTSAKRLFMVVAQMLKYSDASTPVRFLIAESESAFTVLTALYYAKLFGTADRVDVCPLFETERALEVGSRVIDQLLENPHYRAYVEARGRLCVQTGYSDAGRYLGQTPAAASIERLRLRIARLFPKHGLKGVRLVMFDTHGESIGRGGHPASLEERLSYVSPPATLSLMEECGIDFKQEVSFQGGDGYLPFVTQAGAFAVLSRILDYRLGPHAPASEDPFYAETDYITEFFTTVKEFQVSLMRDPNYNTLLTAFSTNLLYPSGSRASKRQHDAPPDPAEQGSATQIRAIPHNAILLQLGLPANAIGGVGAAIDKDPDRFATLYRHSPRFRQLMGIVEYGVAVSSPSALKAYVDTLDPGLWLLRADKAEDPARGEEMRQLADLLEGNPTHIRQTTVFRKLFKDFCILRSGLAAAPEAPAGVPSCSGPGGCARMVAPPLRSRLDLLHAVRLVLIHEVFRLATHVPQFSSQHATTHEQVIARILHLDVETAVKVLRLIFPTEAPSTQADDFGEPASYRSDESQNYRQENDRLFTPMTGLSELIQRVSSAIIQHIGFFG